MNPLDDVLAEAKALGFTFRLDEKGQPIAKGPPCEFTDKFKNLLKAYRADIIAYLIANPPPPPPAPPVPLWEILFPGTGLIKPLVDVPTHWDSGAYFYRQIGSVQWVMIPGRVWTGPMPPFTSMEGGNGDETLG